MNKPDKYYIYYHIDPRDGLPKYIGKGCGKRAWEFSRSRRSIKYSNWIKSLKRQNLKPLVFIGKLFKEEKECFDVEIKDIAFLRKAGINLKNIANGGQGVRLSRELIQKRSEKFKKPIICTTNNIKYSSSMECARALNIDPRRITDVLKARKKSYKGYRFLYQDEKLNEKYNTMREKQANWFIHTTGVKSICVETKQVYNTFAQLAKELNISTAYISRKFKDRAMIDVDGKQYKRI